MLAKHHLPGPKERSFFYASLGFLSRKGCVHWLEGALRACTLVYIRWFQATLQALCDYMQELRIAGAAAAGGRLAVSTGMPLLGRRYRYLSLLGEGATAQARAHKPRDTLASQPAQGPLARCWTLAPCALLRRS